MAKKYIFLDRDGTLIDEPDDKQADCIYKLQLKQNVIPALILLQQAGYELVMITNQDGLGTHSFTQESFDISQNMLLKIFKSQGITFDNILICPHMESDTCQCRKPNMGLVMEYMRNGLMDFKLSFVIGDRETDKQLAENMGINSVLYNDQFNWLDIAKNIIERPRNATITRKTVETDITATIDLDNGDPIEINTGIKFFDHMLDQLVKHAGCSLILNAQGDIDVDEHHTVEDTAIALGEAMKIALGDKSGINRYGF